MIENPLGCAMQLHDGTLSVIVEKRLKEPLRDCLAARRLRFSEPQQLKLQAEDQFEIIVTAATEQDFQEWTRELCDHP